MGDAVRPRAGKATLVKLIIGGALFAFVASRCDLGSAVGALGKISIPTALAVVSLTLAAHAVGAIKWRLFIRGIALRDLFTMVMISNFYSFVLPGQIAGELSKVVKLGGDEARRHGIMVSVILDRLTGVTAIALTGIVGGVAGSIKVPVPLAALLAAAGVASLIVCVTPLSEIVASLLNRGLRAVGNRRRNVDVGEVQRRSLVLATREHGRMAIAVLLGTIYQVLCVAMAMILARGLGIHVAFLDWCWIFSAMSILTMIPISVAGIGIREGSLVGCLSFVGIASGPALGLGIALFGVQLIFAIAGWVIDVTVRPR